MSAKVLAFPERRGMKQTITVHTKEQLIAEAIRLAESQGWDRGAIEHLIREMSINDAQEATDIFEADFADVVRVRWA